MINVNAEISYVFSGGTQDSDGVNWKYTDSASTLHCPEAEEMARLAAQYPVTETSLRINFNDGPLGERTLHINLNSGEVSAYVKRQHKAHTSIRYNLTTIEDIAYGPEGESIHAKE